MPTRSLSYDGALDHNVLTRALGAFREASAGPIRFAGGRLSRGSVRWDLDAEAEFLELFAASVDDGSLSVESNVGELRLTVERRSPRTQLVVRLPTVEAVEAVESVSAQVAAVVAPAAPPAVLVGNGRSPLWRELADHLRDHHGVKVLTYESAVRAGVPNHVVLQELAERTKLAFLVHTVEERDERGVGRTGKNIVHETTTEL